MIYLDHAAATPLSPKVLEAMQPYFSHDFFNPSAAYLPAKKVASDYEAAKATIAHAIGAKASDLIITSSATEANNLALTATGSNNFLSSAVAKDIDPTSITKDASILYLVTEHDSVRRAAIARGGAPIMVDKYGIIDLNDLKNKITDKTKLISVALVNNELGCIQPLADIVRLIREIRLDRLRRGVKTQLLLHSDASQAINLLDIGVSRLGVDLMTISSAKIYGPKGVGALYVAHGVKLSPVILGGGQESGLRSGTENVPGVIGFATAITEAKAHLNSNRKKYADFKKIFLEELGTLHDTHALQDACISQDTSPQLGVEHALAQQFPDYKIINHKHSLDNFIVLCYNSIDAERLIYLLEAQEIYVSTGAACAASKGQKSHVLTAIGLTDAEIAGSLRITFGETNDIGQIRAAARAICQAALLEYRRVNEGH